MREEIWQKEGDAWFERNRQALDEYGTIRTDWPLTLLKQYGIKPNSALEIGCSNGWRLELLREQTGADCCGVDISEAAIECGRKQFPGIQLAWGTADSLPWIPRAFDLVIATFMFHCIDRKDLLFCIAEADRVLDYGGYLLLADFYPDVSCKTSWRGLRDVWTHKLPTLPDIFTATGLYREIARLSFDHENLELSSDVVSKDRAFVALLRKETP